MRKFVVVLVLAVLVAAVFVARRRAAAQAPLMHYETAPVDRGLVVYTVTASGTLSALVTVQVGAQVSGRVQEILVDYNSPVKAGQVIAKLDPLLLQAAVDQARANYLTAQSTVKTNIAQARNADAAVRAFEASAGARIARAIGLRHRAGQRRCRERAGRGREKQPRSRHARRFTRPK